MRDAPKSVRMVLETGRVAKVTAKGLFRFSVSVIRGLYEHDAFDAASSIAFWLFLSLIPALVFAGFVVGLVAGFHGAPPLVGAMLDLAPGASSGVLRRELERLAAVGRDSIGPLAILGFLWTSSSGLHNAMDAFEIIVRVPLRRPWWQQRLMAVAWVLSTLALMSLLAWIIFRLDLVGVGRHLRELIESTSVTIPSGTAGPRDALRQQFAQMMSFSWERALIGLLLLALVTSGLALFFRISVTHPRNVRRRSWPGAVASMLCFLLVTWGFGKFVINLNDYTIYYGSLAAVAVLLIWLYLTSLALLIGVEVNARLEGIRGSFHELFGES